MIRCERRVIPFLALGLIVAALPLCSCQAKQEPAPPAAAAAPSAETKAANSSNSKLPSMFDQMSGEQSAGRIFGQSVPLGNYYFAKRVSYMFPRPWEENASAADRERFIWEALILHFESFRRGIAITDEELEKRINNVLKGQKQAFTRKEDPAAYEKWVKESLNEDTSLFENQMRYLYQVDKLKDQMRESFSVSVTEEEMQQEFLNEQNHVGGEMVTFEQKAEAEAFYQKYKEPGAWEKMKEKGDPKVRPVSLMTLEAYMDLWGIPKAQMVAFHGLELGSIGEPMPFGKQWCVYRLLDKRVGDLTEFPKRRDEYVKQLTIKKQYEELKKWTESLKESAKLEIFPITQQ